MKNNKLLVMIITFIVMIVLTPVIFGKLMNTKFNTMMLKLQQQKGIEIKEVKDKSSYLATDRIFEVTIPGEVFDDSGIKYVKLLTEVKFKNLPVTNVYFHNKIEDIKLQSGDKVSFAKKIVFDITTPDFKTYAFVVKPLKYQTFSLDKVSGVFKIEKNNFELIINKLLAKDKNIELNINHFISKIKKYKNLFKSENSFNIKLQILDKKIEIKNINIENILKTDKKTSIDFKLSFSNLDFSKIIDADNFYTKIKIYDLNTTLFDKAITSKDKNLTLKLIANGLKLDINSSLNNLVFLGFKEGGFKLNIKTIIYKAKSLKDFENNFKKYLAINIKADISENFAKMLKESFPLTKQFLNIPPDKNGIIHIRINLARGSIK